MRLTLPKISNAHGRQGIWFWLAAAVLAGLLLWQLVRLVFLLLSPVIPVGGWQPRQAVIAPVEERAAILSRYNPFTGQTLAATGQSNGPARVTTLDLVLYGTRMNAVTDTGSAIIAGTDGVQKNFLIGDEVVPGVKLVAVAFDNVTLERGGVRESLFIDQSDEVATIGGNEQFAPDNADEGGGQDGGEDFEINVDSLSQGLSFQLRNEGNKVTGLSIGAQSNALALDWLGFQQGDIVVQYDNIDITSAEDSDAFLQKMQPGARFSVLVERGASIVPIAIILPED
jgi:general secretion pathway protein C